MLTDNLRFDLYDYYFLKPLHFARLPKQEDENRIYQIYDNSLKKFVLLDDFKVIESIDRDAFHIKNENDLRGLLRKVYN